jgi:exodeoxyribonuclease-1
MQTIFWHDYETFGADPRRDRPSQFAGVRTDLDLNLIETPITLYAKPSEDYLPNVDACFITGITPQIASLEGVTEAEFAKVILNAFGQPETCVAGYNSVRFDDEVSRNLFYRNLYDPYEREWKNGNSRWDIIDVARLAYALRPEGINWPKGEDGNVSFRLEKLTEANGIAHEAAHDAMSDVYATIDVARLIKSKQPKLFDYAFNLRTKGAVKEFFDKNKDKPFLHVSSKVSVSKGCCAMMLPLMPHPTNSNAVIAFDLRQDPKILLDYSAEQIKERMYMAADQLQVSGWERPALKLVHMNKCPMVMPASMIKEIPEASLVAWELDLVRMRENLRTLNANRERLSHIVSIFEIDDSRPEPTDPDLMIYSGGFLSSHDKSELARIRAMSSSELADCTVAFNDARLDEMLFRYKARNFPDSLSHDEQEKWLVFCQSRLISGEFGFLNFETYAKSLQDRASMSGVSPEQMAILEELQLYGEAIYPL